jgi:hypothetical protein
MNQHSMLKHLNGDSQNCIWGAGQDDVNVPQLSPIQYEKKVHVLEMC